MGCREETCHITYVSGNKSDHSTNTCCTSEALAQGYETLFMLNSDEHEISTSNKYQNTNKFNFFTAQKCWAWDLSC